MSATFSGKVVNFQVDNSGYSQVVNLTTFTLSGSTWKFEDTTSMDNSTRVETTQPTIRNDGKLSLVISPYLPLDANHAFLRSLNVSGAANNFKITYAAPTGLGSEEFSGYVGSFVAETPVNGLQKAKVDITLKSTLVDDAATLQTVTVTDAHVGTYVTGDVIQLTGTFDEIVNVTGTPRISVVLTSGTVFCNYASGTGTNKLVFAHTVGSGDAATATHFSISSPIGLNSGTIHDVAGSAATLTFTPPTTTAFTVN